MTIELVTIALGAGFANAGWVAIVVTCPLVVRDNYIASEELIHAIAPDVYED